MFRVGQKVVCVDDALHMFPGQVCDDEYLDGLKEGTVYHIRWVGTVETKVGSGILNFEPDVFYVRIREILRKDVFGHEVPYFSWRFAPLLEKKTDIGIFKKLTRPKTKKLKTKEDA